jgi:cytochrome c-type biogenesis protein
LSVSGGTTGSRSTARRNEIISFVVPALVVAALLGAVIRVQANVESAAANVTVTLPFLFAFLAGMVASVNPCGFVMLPTYISYHLGNEEEGFYRRSLLERAGRGLLLGVAATGGFIAVAAAVGLVVAAGGQWLTSTFRFFGAVLGVVLLGLGLWLLLGRGKLALMAASRVHVNPRRNLGNVVAFGAAYSISSLSCTLPIFLAVVGIGLGTQGLGAAFGQFMGYALGMGSVLVAVTVGAALFRGAVARWLRGSMLAISRASAMFLVGAGGYLIYYWVVFADAFGWFAGA